MSSKETKPFLSEPSGSWEEGPRLWCYSWPCSAQFPAYHISAVQNPQGRVLCFPRISTEMERAKRLPWLLAGLTPLQVCRLGTSAEQALLQHHPRGDRTFPCCCYNSLSEMRLTNRSVPPFRLRGFPCMCRLAQPSPATEFQNVLITPKRNTCPLALTLHSSIPQTLATANLLFMSGEVPVPECSV